jgi:hypothetical protein
VLTILVWTNVGKTYRDKDGNLNRMQMSWRFEGVREDGDSQEGLESRYERTETFRVFQYQDNLCISNVSLNKSMILRMRVV